MKQSLFLKILLLFSLLLVSEISISLILTRFFYYENIVYLSIDISHLLIILLMIRIWKIDLKELFKKIKLINIPPLLFIGLLLTLLYPILNIPNLINSLLNNTTGIMSPNTDFFQEGQFDFTKLYFVLRTLFIMPFLEEILYRGIIQNKFIEGYTAFWAICFSSLFFAIGHMEFEQSIVTFFSGIVIGLIYYKTKNLSSVVFLHIIINVCFLFIKTKYYNSLDFRLYGYHIVLITVVILVLKKVYVKK